MPDHGGGLRFRRAGTYRAHMAQRLNRETIRGVAIPAGKKSVDIYDTEAKGLFARVWPSGRVSFYLRYVNGEGRRTNYRLSQAEIDHVNITEVRDQAGKARARIHDGHDPQEVRQARRKESRTKKQRTLGAFIENQYSLHAKTHNPSADALLARIKTNFADWWDDPLETITKARVAEWRTKRKRAGRKNSTINRDVAALSSALSYAVERELLEKHPFKGSRKWALPEDRKPRVRYLSESEGKCLHNALRQRDSESIEGRRSANEWRRERGYDPMPEIPHFADHLTPLVTLALNTGLRRGELFNLRWQDVEFSGKRVTVEGQGSKTGQTRHVPLNRAALEVLTKWKEQRGGTKADYVFPAADGGRLTNVKKAWQKLMERAGIEDFRFHDCRHDFASKLVMAGVSLYQVKELCGHSTIKVTERYAHLAPERQQEAVELLSERYGN